MAQLRANVPVHDGKLFDWRDRKGAVDASTLAANGDSRAWMARMYDDACDVGFVVCSHRTGASKAFFLEGELVSAAQGETYAWKFRSADGLRVVVFND